MTGSDQTTCPACGQGRLRLLEFAKAAEETAAYTRRQTEFHERAAKAAEKTAVYTRRYAKYMLWSVLFLALSAFGTLIIQVTLLRTAEEEVALQATRAERAEQRVDLEAAARRAAEEERQRAEQRTRESMAELERLRAQLRERGD